MYVNAILRLYFDESLGKFGLQDSGANPFFELTEGLLSMPGPGGDFDFNVSQSTGLNYTSQSNYSWSIDEVGVIAGIKIGFKQG